jgi:pantoate--beta-alanine ligase
MKTATTIEELRKARTTLENPLGLVPTMGFLHEGHLSLVREAKRECESAVVSIFVNPTQFSPTEDLSAYPRDLDKDLELLEKEETDLVWIPTPEEMYPENFQTWVTVERLTHHLEGINRPEHFRGVTTVVTKLFNAVQPQKAYFGQKDAQQSVIIRRMVKDLDMPIDIVVCPTVREPDGLAMSSRNTYLNEGERRAATVLFRSLSKATQLYETGERNAEKLRQSMLEVLAGEPLAEIQYVSVADLETLEEKEGEVEEALLSMAVRIGKTRLIDNVILEVQSRGQ